MQILFLGTSSMVPTKERNHSSILISYGSEGILVDCGEGTQRQLKIAGIKLTKVNKILISHWHSDHILGLTGLIQSMSASDYHNNLQIYGPKGTKEFIKKMFELFAFDNRMSIEVSEIKSGKFFENDDFILEAEQLKHSIAVSGYSFIEKDKRKLNINLIKKIGIKRGPLLGKLQSGKNIVWKGKKVNVDKVTYIVKGRKLTIINDTVPCNGANKLAKNSDLLVCESTYSSDLEGKAAKHMHMTSKQAAVLAKKSNTKRLVLTHFSARYKNTMELEKDAKKYFKNVLSARDFMKIHM